MEIGRGGKVENRETGREGVSKEVKNEGRKIEMQGKCETVRGRQEDKKAVSKEVRTAGRNLRKGRRNRGRIKEKMVGEEGINNLLQMFCRRLIQQFSCVDVTGV